MTHDLDPNALIAPVKVSVIGNTGDGVRAIAMDGVPSVGGEGTGDGIKSGTIAITPGPAPNVLIQVITPLMAITVRFLNLFFVTLSGLLGAKGIGTTILDIGGDFSISLKGMLIASLIVAAVGLVKDCATIFGKLEGKFPLLTGSI